MKRNFLKKAFFLLSFVVGSVNGAWAYTKNVTDQASWNEAMQKLKSTKDEWNELNICADFTLTENTTFDDSSMSSSVRMVVLNLNGHKLTANNIVVDGTDRLNALNFILKDGNYKAVTFNSNTLQVTNENDGCLILANAFDVEGKANFLFESGVIDGESSNHPVVRVFGDQTGQKEINSMAIINNGYIKGKEGCADAFGRGAILYVDGTRQLIYYNGKKYGETNGNPVLTCLDNAPVSGNGTHNATKNCGGTNITVGKSIVVGNITTAGFVACGIYHPQKGSLTINDGAQIYANGGVGVLMRGGTLNMKGGKIVASGDKDLTGKVGDSRVVVPTSGIVFDDCAGYYDHANVSVAVSGGTVTGSHSAVEVVKGETSANPEKQIQLSGGDYSSDVAIYTTEGKGSKQYSNSYSIEDEEAMVESAGNPVARYASLNDAFHAAPEGSTVKLYCDLIKYRVIVGEEADSPKSISFDLNGKTLTTKYEGDGTPTELGVFVYCNLTVKDSKGNGKMYCWKGRDGYIQPLFRFQGAENKCSLTIDGGVFEASKLYTCYDSKNHVITVNGGYFKSGNQTQFLVNQTDIDVNLPIKIYRAYFAKEYSDISAYLDAHYTTAESGVDGYPVMTKIKPVELVYGETTQQVDLYENNLTDITIDLKDDAATAAERLSEFTAYVDKADINVTLQKNFAKANVWNAFYVPFDITTTSELLGKFDIAKIWDTELYWNNGTPETTIEFIKLNEGDKIAAFTPCLIRAKESGKQDIIFQGVTLYNNYDIAAQSIECSTVEQQFTFTGVLKNTTLNGNYALNGNGQLVQSTNSAAQVSPFKFYMTVTNKNGSTVQKAQAYRMRVIGEDATGISGVNASEKQQGVAVGSTTVNLPAGVYIQNGRKVVVK